MVEGVGRCTQLGTPLDDVGEAFDKSARLLGLDLDLAGVGCLGEDGSGEAGEGGAGRARGGGAGGGREAGGGARVAPARTCSPVVLSRAPYTTAVPPLRPGA